MITFGIRTNIISGSIYVAAKARFWNFQFRKKYICNSIKNGIPVERKNQRTLTHIAHLPREQSIDSKILLSNAWKCTFRPFFFVVKQFNYSLILLLCFFFMSEKLKCTIDATQNFVYQMHAEWQMYGVNIVVNVKIEKQITFFVRNFPKDACEHKISTIYWFRKPIYSHRCWNI